MKKACVVVWYKAIEKGMLLHVYIVCVSEVICEEKGREGVSMQE